METQKLSLLWVDFATIFMTPRIAEFARRYPGITFEFNYSTSRRDGSIW